MAPHSSPFRNGNVGARATDTGRRRGGQRRLHSRTGDPRADAFYNDIVGWRWPDVPRALGVDNVLAFRARTYGELDNAFTATAAAQDRMVFIEAVLPRWISRSCSPNWRSLRRPRTPACVRP